MYLWLFFSTRDIFGVLIRLCVKYDIFFSILFEKILKIDFPFAYFFRKEKNNIFKFD